MKKKICGIYGIKNTSTGRTYVGKSTDVKNRIYQHRSALKHGKHFNPYLQNSYNKHGADNFEYIILEQCNEKELPVKEQFWIDNMSNIYNQATNVLDHTGWQQINTDRVYLLGERKKMAFAASPTLSENKVLQIKEMLLDEIPRNEISAKFNVTRDTIDHIAQGSSWTSVTGGRVIAVTYEAGIRKFNAQHRQLLREARLGRKLSEETRKKISNCKKGRQCSNSQKEKLKKANSQNPSMAKLTKSQVLQIRDMLELGSDTHNQIAKQFDVSRSAVQRIAYGKTWSHITGGRIKSKGR